MKVQINTVQSAQSEAMKEFRATQQKAHQALATMAQEARKAIGLAEHWADIIADLEQRAQAAEDERKKAVEAQRNAERVLQHEKHAHSLTRKNYDEMRDLLLKYESVADMAPASMQRVDAAAAKLPKPAVRIPVRPTPGTYISCKHTHKPGWYVVDEADGSTLHRAVTDIANELTAVLLANLLTTGTIALRPGKYTDNY